MYNYRICFHTAFDQSQLLCNHVRREPAFGVVFLQHQQETGPKPNQPVLMAVLSSILTAYIQKTQDLIDENVNALLFFPLLC